MFKKLVSKIVGDPNQKIIADLQPLVDEVGALEAEFTTLSDEELRQKTAELRERALSGEPLEDILPMAAAIVREASIRTTGMRHYDVQIMGGILLHRNEVVEMRTGEGKTLVGTLPLYLNALSGKGVHLVTVNEYLARRDGGWMGKIFDFLGLSVGCIGPQGFSALYDADYVHPGAELEDERMVHWRPCTRQEAYRADITYGISSEFGFDYLRDNMATDPERLVQRDLNFAVIDEVDNVLIDEARTPLIISGPAARSGTDYARFSTYVRNLRRNTAEEDEEANGHYDIDEKSRSVNLTDLGIAEIEKRIPEIDVEAGDSLYDPRFYHLTYYLDNAMRAQYLFKLNVQYMVADDQVIIIDDFTGRAMPGRRYSDGLHEAIEAKEKVAIKRETVTVATITLQNYFRLYEKLAGMTGTALTDAEEFDKIYEIGVTPLPTNVQYVVDSGEMGLEAETVKVENTDAVRYVDPTTSKPVFFKRVDFKDQVYGTQDAKDQAIIKEIKRVNTEGRPVLVGTTSVEHSEVIHKLLNREKIAHKVLNAKIHESEAMLVAQAGRKSAVTISTNMAGRGTDILLGGNPEGMAAKFAAEELFDQQELFQLSERALLDGRNAAEEMARHHKRLSPDLVDWILRANDEIEGALGEVERIGLVRYVTRQTYKTYGLDYNAAEAIALVIQSGDHNKARAQVSEVDGDVAFVDHVARDLSVYSSYLNIRGNRQGTAQTKAQSQAKTLTQILFDQHYNARAALIRAMLSDDEGEAQSIVDRIPGLGSTVIEQIEKIRDETAAEQHKIWELGGLHVVGSERHESRRIDNQLRGRAARQGDPGSSRFFLSLEDDLMLRFGGERLKNFMARTSIPDDMPIENSMLDRIIESSQERIEGYNFDLRKNVVEYDDVMSLQRKAIYGQRRAILLGEAVDLDEQISEAFELAIGELVNNYVIDYPGFVRGEVDRVIGEFSTDATDAINIFGVLRQLQGLLPRALTLDRDELGELSGDDLSDRLMQLAHENEERGDNLYQLLRAMGRFLPILPAIPNLSILAAQRTGQIQIKDKLRREYIDHVSELFHDFLAEQIPEEARARIWGQAETGLDEAFAGFKTEGLTAKTVDARQDRFRQQVNRILRDLLLGSLSSLDGEQLIEALDAYVVKRQNGWRKQIGDEEYRNFQRHLLLSAIDAEWRDYLTAMDDLRREIGLTALGQRDPKVEYKKRSYEMFTNMRENIDKDVADRFFRQIGNHQAFVQRQQAEIAYREQAQSAGYQVVSHGQGKGVTVKRAVAKVGRNELCPCGSGKKYKQCHGRSGGKSQASVTVDNGAGVAAVGRPVRKKKKAKRRKR